VKKRVHTHPKPNSHLQIASSARRLLSLFFSQFNLWAHISDSSRKGIIQLEAGLAPHTHTHIHTYCTYTHIDLDHYFSLDGGYNTQKDAHFWWIFGIAFFSFFLVLHHKHYLPFPRTNRKQNQLTRTKQDLRLLQFLLNAWLCSWVCV